MKKILFALEGLNCTGGGHVASRNLIRRLLQDNYEVGVLSNCKPSQEIASSLKGAVFHLGCNIPYHSFSWLLTGIFRKVMHSQVYPAWIIDPLKRVRKVMLNYDVIVVCGEISIYRELVSSLPAEIYKVQHIHTNYKEWIDRDPGARSYTLKDHLIYPKFDVIALIGQKNAVSFTELFPDIHQRIFTFMNLLKMPRKRECVIEEKRREEKARIITLARIDDLASKDGFRMVRVAKKLLDTGCQFVWDIYGGGQGEIYDQITAMVKELGIEKNFCIHEYEPDVCEKINTADIFVLLSHYEGLPNVIYESMSAGVPVFATNVGGIGEQIKDGVNGWLVVDDEEVIVARLKEIICSCQKITQAKEILEHYNYDNERIYLEHKQMMKI